MKKISYFEIFKKALLIAWKNKFLWWFGFFILLGSFGDGVNYQEKADQNSLQIQNDLLNFFQSHQTLAISLIALFLIIFLSLFILQIVSRASIIKTVGNLDLYSKQSFGFIFREGLAHLKILFIFELLMLTSIICLFSVLIIPIVFLFSLKAYFFAVTSTIAALAIFFPILIMIFFVNKYFYAYRVLGNVPFSQAIEGAYHLFRANIKESVLMAIYSFILNIIFIFAALFALLLSALPFVIVGIVPYFIFGKTFLIIIGSIVGIFMLLVAIAIFSFWETFKQTAWVLFFQEITNTQTTEKKEGNETIETKEAISAGALGHEGL